MTQPAVATCSEHQAFKMYLQIDLEKHRSRWHGSFFPSRSNFSQMPLLQTTSSPVRSKRSKWHSNLLGMHPHVHYPCLLLVPLYPWPLRWSKTRMHKLSRSSRLLSGTNVSLLLLALTCLVTRPWSLINPLGLKLSYLKI